MTADYELARAFKYHQAGDLHRAEKHYRKAIERDRNSAVGHINFGAVLFAMGRVDDALKIQVSSVYLAPERTEAHNNLGVTLDALNRHDEAIAAFRRALSINAGHVNVWNNLGNSLNKIGKFEDAELALRTAINLKPYFADANNNMGMTEHALGRFDDAIARLRGLLMREPGNGKAAMNLGLVLLHTGSYRDGFAYYDHRWIGDRSKDKVPRWRGESLRGKRLLVWAEQGLGDEILCASMIDDLIAMGADFLWEVDARLIQMLRRSYPSVKFLPRCPPAPPSPEVMNLRFDVQIPAPSLGMYLRDSIDRVPRDRRSYLRATAPRARHTANKIIGLSWSSSNPTFAHSKSAALSEFAPLMALPGFSFIDLQYGDTAAERAEHGAGLTHFDDLDIFNDIEGVAAAIASCDVVVTVSNTTAHLAAAMGVPVFVMVPNGLGRFWYWGTSGETTPWYPSATIFRKTGEAWAPVIEAVRDRLLTL